MLALPKPNLRILLDTQSFRVAVAIRVFDNVCEAHALTYIYYMIFGPLFIFSSISNNRDIIMNMRNAESGTQDNICIYLYSKFALTSSSIVNLSDGLSFWITK